MFEITEHDIWAAQRLPGPHYYKVLRWIHEILRPSSYVEIGVGYGESLKLASPPTVAIGIDPASKAVRRWRTDTRIFAMTSAEFFARHDLAEVLGMPHFGLAFIDGAHLFEEARDDFERLARYAGPESVVLFHDTIPFDERTSARERTTEFYTGDVWRILSCLEERRELDVTTVQTPPSGLTMVRWRQADRQPSLPNARDEVQRWLLRQ